LQKEAGHAAGSEKTTAAPAASASAPRQRPAYARRQRRFASLTFAAFSGLIPRYRETASCAAGIIPLIN